MATDGLTLQPAHRFLPAGYLFKRVESRPDWLSAPQVEVIHSVSNCISPAFTDYIPHWRHNGFWLFDEPATMREVAAADGVDLAGHTLFFYDVLAEAFHEADGSWQPVVPEPSLPVAVVPPASRRLSGFDVVSFSMGNGPECSPLSCNHLASTLAANRFCLFDTAEAAREALVAGSFTDCEPGPYRIMAVYVVSGAQSEA